MQLTDLMEWWNLIFVLPFVAAVLLTLLQATGALHLGHAGHGIHLGRHIHLGQTAHGHAAHSASDRPAGTGSHPAGSILALLGLGRAPFTVVLSTFGLIWGLAGVLANQLLGRVFSPELFIWPSAGCALVAAAVLTGFLARGFARILPAAESYGSSQSDFLGRTAKAILAITPQGGAVALLDQYKNRVELKCKAEGDRVIPRDSKVVLLYLDDESQRFVVCPLEEFPTYANSLRPQKGE